MSRAIMRLLFDLDGTLTNSYSGISRSIFYALEKLGYPLPEEDISWCIGPPLWESFGALMKTDDKALIEEAVDKYRERFGTIGIFENEVYPGIDQALEELKEAGHVMSVATSKPTPYAERIIEHFDLMDYFVSVDGARMNDEKATKTKLIASIIERDELDPGEVVMIGDRKYDMVGAKANEVTALGVLWGFGTRGELESVGANAYLEAPEDLFDACNSARQFAAG